jgi:hypothetical protein
MPAQLELTSGSLQRGSMTRQAGSVASQRPVRQRRTGCRRRALKDASCAAAGCEAQDLRGNLGTDVELFQTKGAP